jgi:membrane dipeptidase
MTTGLALAAGSSLADEPKEKKSAPPKEDEIERVRRAALEVLKPSEKDLQHGLELHAQSVVFDCYGFAPRASMDIDAFNAAALAGASDNELSDLREEMSMTRMVSDAAEQAEFKRAWRASGVTCVFQNAGEEGQAPLRLLKRLARFTYITDMLPDFVSKAARPDDILAAKKADRQCFYLTGNGVPITQDWNSIEDELGFVRIFHQLGIRMMHLTYNRRNTIGDGCGEPANAGLSDFGQAAIAELNRVGVIADVAHSGWRTSLEAAQVSKRPMVASHTVCDALNHHIRAKPLDVIKAIADGGGLVGICCISGFLGGPGDIRALLDHIDYVVQRVGIDHVGIGTDVGHASTVGKAGTAVRRGPSRKRWEHLWPEGSLGRVPQHASVAWTNWPMFTVGLVQRGYSDADIQKIIGGNMLRVCRDNTV